jgi:hypothetical protein
MVADMPAGSVSVGIRFVYTPCDDASHPQERLAIFLYAQARQQCVANVLETLLMRGPFATFYRLEPAAWPALPTDRYAAACFVSRRAFTIAPSIPKHLNANVPDTYYVCSPFAADKNNLQMLLDSVFDQLREPACIDVSIEPADVAPEAAALSAYVSRVRACARPWQRRDDDQDWHDQAEARERGYSVVRGSAQPDAVADSVLRDLEEMSEHHREPHVRYHLIAAAGSEATARLLGSALAESAFEDGSYQLGIDSSEATMRQVGNALGSGLVMDLDSRPTAVPAPTRVLGHLMHIASASELLGAFRLPVASLASPRCARKSTDPATQDSCEIVLGHDAPAYAWGGAAIEGVPRGVSWRCLVKHLFISGMPGSGKTNTALRLLIELGKAGIPFLVIECVKKEYRALKRLRNHGDPALQRFGRRLEVFTAGRDDISPLRLNPLELIEGVSPALHIDSLLEAFESTMPTGGPLPGLIGEALEEVYEKWDSSGITPTLTDLVRTLDLVIARQGYVGDVDSNIRAAAKVRVSSTTRRTTGGVFQSPFSEPPPHHLVGAQAVVELDAVSGQHKCLIVLLLLSALLDALRASTRGNEPVRFVILIDEAHVVVGPDTNARPSEENPNPAAYTSRLICRMMAELRAMGAGVVVSDQSPSNVAADVIKLAGTQIAFRHVADDDRQRVTATMLGGKAEYEDLARLRPGEAYLLTEGYHRARRIRTVDMREEFDLSELTDEALLSLVADEPWFIGGRKQRHVAELLRLDMETQEFRQAQLEALQETLVIRSRCRRCRRLPRGQGIRADVPSWQRRLRELEGGLRERRRQFVRGPLRALCPPAAAVRAADAEVAGLRREVLRECESVSGAFTDRCSAILADVRRQLNTMEAED